MIRYTLLLCLNIFLFSSSAQEVKKSMLRIPDTGVSSSYTNTFGEDNDYNIFIPFFLNHQNGTLTDTITGLMWQQSDGGEMTFENAVIYCDTLTIGNYNNWRLPTAHEAFSILNHQFANPSLSLDFTKTAAEYWWTSDKQQNDPTKIWATNAGGGIGNHSKLETISAGGPKKFHVRAVRDVNSPISLPQRFTDNGNGTITDHLSNLIWQKVISLDSFTWEQALVYADSVSIAGMTDWRLPNIKELRSINDESIIIPSLNPTFFSISKPQKYWSSTTLPNQTNKAWYLNTQFGITTYDLKTFKHPIICVRSNQSSTALNENTMDHWVLFPNPFHDKIYIENAQQDEQYELFNHLGELIYQGFSIQNQDFSSLTKGLYYLRVKTSTNRFYKLIKE